MCACLCVCNYVWVFVSVGECVYRYICVCIQQPKTFNNKNTWTAHWMWPANRRCNELNMGHIPLWWAVNAHLGGCVCACTREREHVCVCMCVYVKVPFFLPWPLFLVSFFEIHSRMFPVTSSSAQSERTIKCLRSRLPNNYPNFSVLPIVTLHFDV